MKPDVISFNALVNAHSKAGDTSAAARWLVKMRSQYGVSPDVVTYNAMIDGCARKKDTKPDTSRDAA